MARFAYFIDMPDGTILEWRDTIERGQVRAARGVQYREGKGFFGFHETLGSTRITRCIELKANPSRHECDSRCLNATGRNMKCECSCGGKNHGRGAYICETAA